MTGPDPADGRQGRPEGAGGGQVSFPKAALLVVVAVVVGVLLLHAATSSPSHTGSGSTSATTTTTTAGHGTTTTTTTTIPPSKDVKVLVANGSPTTGAAGYFTSKVTSAGWGTLPATDASSSSISTSAVYYASGQQAAATAIAALLGLKPSAVQPLSTSVPVTGTTGADVVVVIGSDLSSQATTTTTG
ncbi:MAG TPA: LytR C-terminal domain-containing protein [Acidimicrobiales bacterium]|nr:LytR C-terminal domain-containing protein [Acidimicrobiales bacterium]